MISHWIAIGIIAGMLAREYLSGRRNLSALEAGTFFAVMVTLVIGELV